MLKTINKKSIVLIFYSLIAFYPSVTFGQSVTAMVKSTVDKVLAVLSDPAYLHGSDKEIKKIKIRKIIKSRFDFNQMAKRSLGKNWKNRSRDEKKRFVFLFTGLIESSYMNKLEAYTDEKIIYVGEMVRNKKAEVKAKIITKKGIEIPINYRLLKIKNGDWKVYDIVIEGVSLIRNYRTEFNRIINRHSFSELISRLEKKVNTYKNTKN